MVKLLLQNDKGAPLMCYSVKLANWQVHGILSYQGNCGGRPQPNVYNSLARNVSTWIVNTVGNSLMYELA